MRVALVRLSVLGSVLLALLAVFAAIPPANAQDKPQYTCVVPNKGASCPAHQVGTVPEGQMDYIARATCALSSSPTSLFLPSVLHCSSPNTYMDCSPAPNRDTSTYKACKCGNDSKKAAPVKVHVTC